MMKRRAFLFVVFLFSISAFAEEQKKQDPAYNFDDENAYIDILDAMKSRRFMHRVIIKEAIEDSSHFQLGRPYFNHMIGFSAVHQEGDGRAVHWAEFVTGFMGLSGGYVSKRGHAGELGLEMSAVSSLYLGYRYFLRVKNLAVWPFAGAGVTTEISFLRLSNGPVEAQIYQGPTQGVYGAFGLLLPLLDIGMKIEFRMSLYGASRVVFTQGLGAILFF